MTKNDAQDLFDYFVKQLELSIREIGYGDVSVHKKMKDLDEDKSGPTKVTNNAMFVGSTSELQKMLKQMGGGKR